MTPFSTVQRPFGNCQRSLSLIRLSEESFTPSGPVTIMSVYSTLVWYMPTPVAPCGLASMGFSTCGTLNVVGKMTSPRFRPKVASTW